MITPVKLVNCNQSITFEFQFQARISDQKPEPPICMRPDGKQKFEQLRNEYPEFIFEDFDTVLDHEGLKVVYRFSLSGKYSFRPGFILPVKPSIRKRMDAGFINSPGIRDLLFHIGMIELVSYWKAACPPLVTVKCRSLTPGQVAWWKKVFFHGLGEFFHTNGIETGMNDFMRIESTGPATRIHSFPLNDSVMVPVGGGKDSVVTLELLRSDFDIQPFILNPRGASLETSYKAGFSNITLSEINRRIDPQLIRLNEEGFLNGHTPFSALLAFYTLLAAAVNGRRHIALSNESSANEPTIPGTEVNHQYSKSFAFEKDFREYVSTYISGDFNYFSFLRPLNELQIARLFALNVKYYPVFKSCNVGSKTDTWCGHCPKCLFAWIILCPFIPLNELIHIFGKNLFEDAGMIGHLKELTGIEEVKPFECVGTVDEVNTALHLFIKNHSHEKWPLLIDYYSNTSNFSAYREGMEEEILSGMNDQHFLEPRFLDRLKIALA